MINLIYALAFFSSQFYIFESGVPQPAHYLFLIAIFFTLYKSRWQIGFSGHKAIYAPLYAFIAYAIFINLIWSIILQSFEFNLSSIYYVYGFVISLFISSRLYSNNRFRLYLTRAAIFGIFALVFANLVGLGRYFFAPRYNGFFNDPNQMAFWVICSYSIFCLIEKNKVVVKMLLFMPCAFLVILSMSRSGLVGLIAIFFGVIAILFSDARNSRGGYLKVYAGASILVALAVFLFIAFFSTSDLMLNVLERFSETDFDDEADIRGYGRIFSFPDYLLFGAGQGLDVRFNSPFEIHSSWAGLLFYYGALGLTLFLIFLYRIVKSLKFSQILIISGPLFYGFFTFSLRTPIFWLLIAAAIFAAKNNNLTSRDKFIDSKVYRGHLWSLNAKNAFHKHLSEKT